MLTVNNTINWLNNFCEALIRDKAALSEYDRIIGDGDHGNNMARGAVQLKQALEDAPPATIGEAFKTAAMTWISKVGGASGPLYGTAFMKMAKVADTKTELDEAAVTALLNAGIAGIQKRGKAVAGEKTMLDVWIPVAAQLDARQLKQAGEATTAMRATKGRASFVGDRSIGEVDPGAASSALFFDALLKEVSA